MALPRALAVLRLVLEVGPALLEHGHALLHLLPLLALLDVAEHRRERPHPREHLVVRLGREDPRAAGRRDLEAVPLGRRDRVDALGDGEVDGALALGARLALEVEQPVAREEHAVALLEAGRRALAALVQPAALDLGRAQVRQQLVQLAPPRVQHRRVGAAQRVRLGRRLDFEEAAAVWRVDHAHLEREAHVDAAVVRGRLRLLEVELAVRVERKLELLPLGARADLHVQLRRQQQRDVLARQRELDGLARGADAVDHVVVRRAVLAVDRRDHVAHLDAAVLARDAVGLHVADRRALAVVVDVEAEALVAAHELDGEDRVVGGRRRRRAAALGAGLLLEALLLDGLLERDLRLDLLVGQRLLVRLGLGLLRLRHRGRLRVLGRLGRRLRRLLRLLGRRGDRLELGLLLGVLRVGRRLLGRLALLLLLLALGLLLGPLLGLLLRLLLGLLLLALRLLALALLEPLDVPLLVLEVDLLGALDVLDRADALELAPVDGLVQPRLARVLQLDLRRLALLPLLDLLDEHRDDLREVALCQLLEHLPLARLEEDLGATQLEGRRRDVERERERLAEHRRVEPLHEVGHLRRVAAVDRLVRDARRVGARHQLDGVDGARAAQLVEHERRREAARRQLGVGLDAADEVRLGGVEVVHQLVEVVDEAARDRVERAALLGPLAGAARALDREERGEDGVRALGERIGKVGVQRVVVLLAEALAKVADVAREVAHHEGLRVVVLLVPRGARLHEEVVAAVRLVDGLAEVLVARVWLLARLVEDAHDACRALLDEVDAALVVLVLDARPRDALLLVQVLLRLEDELEEELLQLLVGKVDAELLEGVDRERLEAVDVEQPDELGRLGRLAADRDVDLVDDVVEELRVHRLGQRVARQHRLLARERHHRRLAARRERAHAQRLLHLRRAKEAAELLEARAAARRGRRGVLALELGVAQVEQPRDHARDRVLLGGVHADVGHGLRELLPRVNVLDARHGELAALLQVPEGLRAAAEPHRRVALVARDHVVEDVVVALALALEGHARLLEQVLLRRRAEHLALLAHRDLDELAEARRVVVARRLRVAEGLEHRVGLQDDGGEVVELVAALLRAERQVAHQVLVGLGLARARLAADHERLRALRLEQRLVRLLRHRVRVRLDDAERAADVRLHQVVAVDRQHLERVDGEQDGAGVRVDGLLLLEAQAHVVEDRRLADVDQVAVVRLHHAVRVGHRDVDGPQRLVLAVGHRDGVAAPGKELLDGRLEEDRGRVLVRILDPHGRAIWDFLRHLESRRCAAAGSKLALCLAVACARRAADV